MKLSKILVKTSVYQVVIHVCGFRNDIMFEKILLFDIANSSLAVNSFSFITFHKIRKKITFLILLSPFPHIHGLLIDDKLCPKITYLHTKRRSYVNKICHNIN